MSDLRQAAQQALDEMLRVNSAGIFEGELNEAITALRQALVEPEQKMTKQKPVAWTDERGFIAYQADSFPRGTTVSPLYAHPPTPRKPLTNEEISAIFDDTLEGGSFFDVALAVARAIERAHGIGGGE